jgi:tetratricopeptide (TPR) repeat protein
LDKARRAGNQVSELQALYALGSYGWATDYHEAILLFEAALPLAEALEDITSQIRILSRMSVLYTNQLQLAEAFDFGHRALTLARELGDGRPLALAMDCIEVAAAFVGDFATLDELAPQLVALHRRHGDLWYLQFALYQWCYAAIGAGRWDDAIAQLEEVLAINRRIGDRGSEPIYMSTLSWVYRSCGAYQEALVYGSQSVAQSEELGNAESTAWNAACLGWTMLEVYALEESIRHLKRGMEAAEGSRVFSHMLRCAGPLAWACWLLGDEKGAQTLSAQAEGLCQHVTAPPDRAFVQGMHAYVAIAWVHLARGEAEQARQLLTPVLEAAERCGWQEAIAYGSLVVGQSLAACGDASGAESAFRQALQTTRNVGLPAVAWKTHAALAQHYHDHHQFEAAERHRKQAQTIIERLAGTLNDTVIRQGFLRCARLQLSS